MFEAFDGFFQLLSIAIEANTAKSTYELAKKHEVIVKSTTAEARREIEARYGIIREIDMSSFSKLVHCGKIGYAFWYISWKPDPVNCLIGKSVFKPVSVSQAKMVLRIRDKQKYKNEFGGSI